MLDRDAYDFFTSEVENCLFPEPPSRPSDQEGVDEGLASAPQGSDQDMSDTVALREQLVLAL